MAVAGPLTPQAAVVPALAGLLITPLIMYKLFPPEIKDTPEAPKVGRMFFFLHPACAFAAVLLPSAVAPRQMAATPVSPWHTWGVAFARQPMP